MSNRKDNAGERIYYRFLPRRTDRQMSSYVRHTQKNDITIIFELKYQANKLLAYLKNESYMNPENQPKKTPAAEGPKVHFIQLK